MRIRCLHAAAALLGLAAAAVGQFQNPGFESGNLTPWNVAPTPNGQTLVQTVESHDIDCAGPLPASRAAKFAVGQMTFQSGQQAGIQLTQVLTLPAGAVTFECDVGATRPSGGSNAAAGRFALIVNNAEIAVQDLAGITGGECKSAHLSGNFNAPSAGNYTVGVKITRPFLPPGSGTEIFQWVDNFRPVFVPPVACLEIIHTGRGSGTLNGVAFGPSDFRIVSRVDPANRQSFGSGFFINHDTSQISIGGVGTVNVITGTRTFVNNSGQIVGYSRAGGSGNDLYNGPVNAAFAAYGLLTPIGPIAGNANLLQWTNLPQINTSGGILIFNNGASAATFQVRACDSESCDVIDFQSLEQPGGGTRDNGVQYDEDGYRLTKGPGEPFNYASFQTGENRYPGSTAMFNNTVNGLCILRRIDGGVFNVTSIDLANLNGGGPAPVTFTGFYPGGASVALNTDTGDPNGLPNTLQTIDFPNTFCGLERLEWRQVSPFHQFDNIRVATPTRIDFESLAQAGTGTRDNGVQYDEDGYRLTKNPGEPFNFASFQTGEGRFPGSTSLFNNTVNGNIILQRIDGGPFDACEIKLANLNGGGPAPVNFVGTRLGGGTVNHNTNTGDPNGLPNVLTRNIFPISFRGLTKLEWRQVDPFHQFDDIIVACSTTTFRCPCACNYDTSTGPNVCDIFDFLEFQNRFAASDPCACDEDLSTGPNVCDIFDFLEFQNGFSAGCP